MRRAGLALAAATALVGTAGCGLGGAVEVRNVNAPDVDFVVNGQDLGQVRCDDNILRLQPGVNAPLLPWRIELLHADGEVRMAFDLDTENGLPRWIYLAREGVLTAPPLNPAEAVPFDNIPCPGS